MESPYIRRWVVFAFLLLATMHFASQALANQGKEVSLRAGERIVPVWVWQVEASKGTIIFSHGAFSAPWKYTALIEKWVDAGYAVYAPLHVDSTDHPHHDQYGQQDSWPKRLEDMQVVAAAFGGDSYIVAGHSYGAFVALVKGGVGSMAIPDLPPPYADKRVKLVLAFSPPGAIPGFIEADYFAGLAVPALIQTGTDDITFGSDKGWKMHLDAYNHAPQTGTTYALVFPEVDHYFGGAICRPELPGPAQTQALDQASAISLQMIDAYYHNSDAGLKRLQHYEQDTTYQFYHH